MDLLEKIYDAGVVGAGGAGFPTHRKLNGKVEYFIINGAECEPLLQTDQYIMREKSLEITAAALAVGKLLEASHTVFALKKKYTKQAEAIKKAASEFGAAVELYPLESVYPVGDEHIVVHEVTGRTVKPGGIPLGVGAVVSNAGTMLHVFEAMCDKPVTHKYVTVTGEVKNPAILLVPIGASVAECIEAAGGAAVKDFNVIMGGPMMGKLVDTEALTSRHITKTDGGIIVIPQGHYLANRASMTVEHMINQAKSACIQCSYCTDMCPRYLIGHKLRPHRVMRAMAIEPETSEALQDAMLCCECGICELYACPMGLSPRRMNAYVKGILRDRGIKHIDTGIYEGNCSMREFRQIPVSRLVPRIGLSGLERHIKEEPVSLKPGHVCIALKQHIGKPGVPVVKTGDRVRAGQLIASVDYNEPGARVHSSIDGRVEQITGDFVRIQSEQGGVG